MFLKKSRVIQMDKYTRELLPDYDAVYVKKGSYALSSRKLESLIKIAELQRFYQCNPVKFINDFFNIELLDSQAFIVQRSWNCPNVLLVCTRGFGKSTLTDLIIMAKDMLYTNYWSYIASGSGSQAEMTFTTLERLANDNIDTMMGSTGYIFKNEVEVKNAAGDGFSHGSDGFTYSLYNGAMTKTLNSNVDRKRGARGHLVVFDECGFLEADMMSVYAAFVIVNKGFATGKDRDGNSIDLNRLRSFPTNIPNQLFYISSASSTDTEFYKLYRDFSKQMILGNPDYFVAHIDCEVAMKPTKHGKVVAPLLTKDTVEAAMRNNPEKARREYYCQFTSDAGSQAIIKRSAIARNSEIRVPLMHNDTNDKRFVITYDPARSRDNAIILISEIYKDNSGEYNMRIVNCVNLLDISKKRKSPMQTPDQVAYLKELILEYNGNAPDYENIEAIVIDAGSGGAGVNIADYLMENWYEKDHEGNPAYSHKGLIDKEYSEDYTKKFPEAINKIKLRAPSAFKSEMFEALIEMMNQNAIKFTADYDNKGYLTILETDEDDVNKAKAKIEAKLKKLNLSEDEYNTRFQKEMDKANIKVNTRVEKLDPYQEIALTNIDALKEEAVNMIRKPRESHKDSFELLPEKVNKLHDDRVYCLAMAAHILQQLRRDHIVNKRKPKQDPRQMFRISKQPKKWGRF